MTHEDISKYTGKSRSHVTNILRLNELSDFVRTKLLNGEIDMGHARAVLSLSSANQASTIKAVISRGLSVRALESLIRTKANNSKNVKKLKSQDTIILEQDISQKLCAEVSISHNNKGQGKLEIKYESLAQLDGIIKKIK